MATLISCQNPRTISKTYDKWWILDIIGQTTAKNTPQQSFALKFVFARGVKTDNVWEISDDEIDIKVVDIADVFAMAQTDPDVNDLLEGLLSKAAQIGFSTGVLD